MFRPILFLCLLFEFNCQLLPVIYAAPSSVSHQSRVDIKNIPQIIATPLVYSPVIYATYPKDGKKSDIVLTQVRSDTVLAPIALTLFHNLPLARALEHPIIIESEDATENQLTNDVENIVQNNNIYAGSTETVDMTLPTQHAVS